MRLDLGCGRLELGPERPRSRSELGSFGWFCFVGVLGDFFLMICLFLALLKKTFWGYYFLKYFF